VRIPALTADSPLSASRLPYHHYLRLSNRSKNTIACFLSDLGIFTNFVGGERPLGTISLEDLERWRRHLQLDEEVGGLEETPKTVARRMTFLKNFFGWLAEEGVLARDPAADLMFRRPLPPLQEVPFEDEVQRLEAAAREEVRCHALVMLVLETGLKKEEVLGLRLRDVDLSDPDRPTVEVRFPRQDKRRRERRMALPAEWTQVYQRYVERFRPVEYVFECTGRNLNYVLASAVRRAGLKRRITLQILRDVYAIRQLRAGVSPEEVRDKLGLSDEAWQEAGDKYRKLAFSV
jgi:integrase/recombinase XerD